MSTPFIDFRRELHRFPELSGQEFETRKRIKTVVSPFAPVRLLDVGKTGLLLQYGHEQTGPVTLIRADIDALPIQEVNDFAHKSRTEGVSHKCGHDGHAAILVRLAAHLAEKPSLKGRVYLLFQPAEETGEGARAVLDDPAFANIRPDRVFALHNLPGFSPGTIVCKPGPFTSSVQTLIVTFTGKVSHSAEPEKGINPAYLMADFTLKSGQLVNPDSRSEDFALITPVYTTMGEKSYGVSAGYGEVHLTLRTRTSQTMERLTNQLLSLLADLSAGTGIYITTAITEVFFASQNHADAFEQVRTSALKLGYVFTEKQEPFKWGEDFGLFTQHYKGAMFGIGAGETSPALHNDDYDFNDDLIEPAARLFLELIDLQHA
ncbi:amidohydrolase [Larkinella knui]|nr:amidohydrolase [Larkinella knui]